MGAFDTSLPVGVLIIVDLTALSLRLATLGSSVCLVTSVGCEGPLEFGTFGFAVTDWLGFSFEAKCEIGSDEIDMFDAAFASASVVINVDVEEAGVGFEITAADDIVELLNLSVNVFA